MIRGYLVIFCQRVYFFEKKRGQINSEFQKVDKEWTVTTYWAMAYQHAGTILPGVTLFVGTIKVK